MKPITLYMALPPSVNAMYRNVPGKGHRGRAKSAAYKAWLAEPILQAEITSGGFYIRPPVVAPLEGKVAVEIEFEKPRRGRSDVSNRIKAVEDRLVRYGLLKDDSQIVDVRARWAKVPGCRVTVTPLEQA